jgi:hypothetical protein
VVRAPIAPQADQVGRVLRRDGVEELRCRRQAELAQFPEEFARQAQALVDLEAAVHARVVDQALPAHRGARLLEIHAHQDQQVIGMTHGFLPQLACVIHRGVVIVDRAGADDDGQAVVGTVKHAMQGLAGFPSGRRSRIGGGKLAQDMAGRR